MTRSTHDNRHEEKRDQDLLLLAHGALPLGRRLWVLARLKRCPQCRARLAELTQASLLLAAAVRGSSLPPWSRADAVSRVSPPGKRLMLPALIGLAAALMAVCCWVAWTALAPASRSAVPAAAGGCRPDLPNSRCR